MKMKITNDIYYVGVNDHKVDLFEGQYVVPNGMAYNSYVIKDEKIAVMDTVDADFADEWLGNVEKALDGRKPDYLVVQHMEPDHSANVARFTELYKDVVVVASAKAFAMMQNFFGTDFADRRIVVGEGDTLELGTHTLTFVTAPMVHWPEVIVTYDSKDKVLFSADGFGKFGALDVDDDWASEARRYYIGIVGKYGAQVQALLKKAAKLDIEKICPLHGPVLEENLGYYLDLYNTWSSYAVESEGVVIAYNSVYGNTKKAVELLEEKLKANGCAEVVLHDLARCDMAKAVEDAFRYGKLVLASPTYNADVFPFMKEFINHLTERNFQNRFVAFIENGSWAPMAAKVMKGMFEKSKNLTFAETTVQIKGALNADSSAQVEALATELCK
jgi:flavorubredoxin